MGLSRYALYLHDYGSQFGFRLAMAAPEPVTALIIQNGDIYEDEFVGELPGRLVERVSPELWTLSSAQLLAPRKTDIIVGLFGDQASTLADFPAMQARASPADAHRLGTARRVHARGCGARLPARPARRLLDGGHWALETNLEEIVALCRDFLSRVDG